MGGDGYNTRCAQLVMCRSQMSTLACRNLVRKRFDITGARWSLAGAEAMLKLRAMRSNDGWHAYWQHHLGAERERIPLRQQRHSSSCLIAVTPEEPHPNV